MNLEVGQIWKHPKTGTRLTITRKRAHWFFYRVNDQARELSDLEVGLRARLERSGAELIGKNCGGGQ